MIEAHLARIAGKLTPSLSAFITVDADGARRQADACDAARGQVGPLHGVPIAVKDLTDTRGLRTTYGSLLFRHHVPEQDELVVARLRKAGAVIIGKANTPEFGFGAVCTNRLCGPTRNPFDVLLTSGGSSGGSAVAVATGMVPLAHGTDFGGSVRTPASFCDVVSIRPTPGRIPVPARALGWDMLATHGFLARTVHDSNTGFPPASDPTFVIRCPSALNPKSGPPGRPQLAVTPDFGVAPVAREVRSRFAAACDVLSRIADLEEVSPECGGGIEAFRTLRAAHIANSYGALLRDRRSELTPTVIWNIEAGGQLTAQDYLAAERRRTAIFRSFRDLFSRKDFLVAPAASVFPWNNDTGDVTRIDDVGLETPIDYLAVTFIVSLVGFPVLTLPTPRGTDQKPFGLRSLQRRGRNPNCSHLAGGLNSNWTFVIAGHLSDQASRCSRRAASGAGRPLVGFASGLRNVPRSLSQTERVQGFDLLHGGHDLIDHRYRNSIGDALSQPRQWRTGQDKDVGVILLYGALREFDQKVFLFGPHLGDLAERAVEHADPCTSLPESMCANAFLEPGTERSRERHQAKPASAMHAVSIAASAMPTMGMSNSSLAANRPGSPKAAMIAPSNSRWHSASISSATVPPIWASARVDM